jgi:electron transfer flavoprotein alpha subunit
MHRPDPAPFVREIGIDAPACLVLVVPDAEGGRLSLHDRQLLGAARQLADAALGAVVILAAASDEAYQAEAARAGGDRLVILPELARGPEQRAAAVACATRALSPRHVLFPESLDGGDLARRVAVLTGETLITDIEALSPRGAIRAAHAKRVEQMQIPATLLSLQPDRTQPYGGIPHALHLHELQPEISIPPDPQPASRLMAGDPATVGLSDAAFVVAAGNGVSDFSLFRTLAARLGATPGGSRMVCDAGLLPRICQIGASGAVLESDCYMALGISGAPQHLQGIGRVGHIIAVNTDLHAAMVERAELAVIADAQAVSAALVEALGCRPPV